MALSAERDLCHWAFLTERDYLYTRGTTSLTKFVVYSSIFLQKNRPFRGCPKKLFDLEGFLYSFSEDARKNLIRGLLTERLIFAL